MKCISTRENRCGLRCGLINTDCVKIKDWGHIEDHVEYQTSIQVSNEVKKQVYFHLRNRMMKEMYYHLRWEVWFKVWFD